MLHLDVAIVEERQKKEADYTCEKQSNTFKTQYEKLILYHLFQILLYTHCNIFKPKTKLNKTKPNQTKLNDKCLITE